MDSPHKRRKLSKTAIGGADFQARRAQQEQRLKTRFESIFDKYEHDFTGIGDEIDLETGEIVVDNGHIERMKYDTDIGNGASSNYIDLVETDSEDTDDDSLSDSYPQSNDHLDNESVNDEGERHMPLQTAFYGLDDVDELGDPAEKVQLTESEHPESRDIFEDELTMHEHETNPSMTAFKSHRKTARDERGKMIEPKWLAPALPHGVSRSRPVHRRITLPLPIRPRPCNIDLGDWRQKHSIWDLRSESQHNAEKRHVERDANASPDRGILQVLGQDWTEEEKKLLQYLKATTTLDNEQLVKYFPRKTAEMLAVYWMNIRDSAPCELDVSASHVSAAIATPQDAQGADGLEDPFVDTQKSKSFPDEALRGDDAPVECSQRTGLTNRNIRSIVHDDKLLPQSILRSREVPDSDSLMATSSPWSYERVDSLVDVGGNLAVDEVICISSDSDDDIFGPSPLVEKCARPKSITNLQSQRGADCSTSKQHLAVVIPTTGPVDTPLSPHRAEAPVLRTGSGVERESCTNIDAPFSVPDTPPTRHRAAHHQGAKVMTDNSHQPSSSLSNPGKGSNEGRSRIHPRKPSASRQHKPPATPRMSRSPKAGGEAETRHSLEKRVSNRESLSSRTLAKVWDEGEDDLSALVPTTTPRTEIRLPVLKPETIRFIPRHALDCSDDELG